MPSEDFVNIRVFERKGGDWLVAIVAAEKVVDFKVFGAEQEAVQCANLLAKFGNFLLSGATVDSNALPYKTLYCVMAKSDLHSV